MRQQQIDLSNIGISLFSLNIIVKLDFSHQTTITSTSKILMNNEYS